MLSKTDYSRLSNDELAEIVFPFEEPFRDLFGEKIGPVRKAGRWRETRREIESERRPQPSRYAAIGDYPISRLESGYLRPSPTMSHYLLGLASMNFAVSRRPHSEMGYGTLGRTWLGTDRIEILDTLQGAEFEEVLLHEQMHQLHPEATELEIRRMTASVLLSTGKAPIFHKYYC
jgi:hypothetical protein